MGRGGKYGQMVYNPHVQEHRALTKKCFISALKRSMQLSTPVYHFIRTLCNEDFSSTSGTTPA